MQGGGQARFFSMLGSLMLARDDVLSAPTQSGEPATNMVDERATKAS